MLIISKEEAYKRTKEKADSNKRKAIEKCWEMVNWEIEDAISKGKFPCHIDYPLMEPEVADQLKKVFHYKVKQESSMPPYWSGDYYVIDWSSKR